MRATSGGVRSAYWPGWLFRIGLAIVAAGAAGDILHHTLPAHLGHDISPLLGADGGRAHLMTLAGMILTLLGVSIPRRAVHRGTDLPLDGTE